MPFLIAVLASTVLLGAADKNDPCRCARSQATVQRDYKRADVVFTGSVVGLDQIQGPARGTLQRATFQVSKVYKGDMNWALSVYVDPGTLCSFEFVTPEAYVVYAWYEHRLKGELTTTRCVRTALLAEATEDLEQLPELSNARPKE